MKKILVLFLLVALFVGAQLQAQDARKPALRTWRDSTGQFSIQATFVRVNGDLVILQGIDKKEITLPATKLSAADQQYVKSWLGTDSTFTNTIGMKLKLIPAGTFMMGSPVTEKDRKSNETQHEVTISKAFYMQTTEVTQGQWKALMGTEPWKGRVAAVKEDANRPAAYISWVDAVAYCKNLSDKESKTYRLPTEAEWEYACRAGTETTWFSGNDQTKLSKHSWYAIPRTKAEQKLRIEKVISGEHVDGLYFQQVGLRTPNTFGLFDMHGNVGEWCQDFYGEDYYKQSPKRDPLGPAAGSFRVCRGGAWLLFASQCRSAFRHKQTADTRGASLGFRLVRELD